ncbi:aspartate aminotransferase family protein [Salibacteraceae bacterium]|nr:aspartate aminotransferase family protein [Salibacteraceae bacterium]MDB4104565.1 aspartate aminotransferase family protein [Salibacteraceae bacterium]MDB9708624.1 aspartate aminotransferase family protein [Salibacteraceae bacterium]MDC1304439.1 aspartate aminotransferase family protein [Salibacteraceae bacterium]HAQ71533.1 aspartate aminotransferase family protein [Flavobacteriales bacterium]
MAFSPHLAQTSPFPLGIEIARADGCYIFDTDGKRYLDLISGIAVTNIGHRHPHVIERIKAQLDLYQHVIPFGEFSQAPQNKLADKLASLLPDQLNCSYFVNSGTEANEAALKLAKRATGRYEIVSMKKSYHGATHGSLSVSGNEIKKQQFRPFLPGTTFIDFNDISQLDRINEKTAAVIVEPIQGDAGVRIPDANYLAALRSKCDATGALLIFDEIQTGMGRTGKLFAFEHYNVIPDIITIAKAFGGGMPIGAFISSKERMDLLTHDPILGHITTFGGHPVCCAAALANLEVLTERETWLSEVDSKGTLFKELLQHNQIKEVRQIGLMMAVELNSPDEVDKVIARLLEEGIIGFYFLSTRNAFRLAPPLCISNEEIEWASSKILKVMEEL